jgi:single-strand DNA-binding protein
MQLIGMARLGRDAELRHTQDGTAVCSLSLAYNHGRKGPDGKRPTQWVDASLWGKQAESLQQYLVKGKQVCVTLNDVRIETYQGRNGEGVKLCGNVTNIELVAGSGDAPAAPAPAPRQQAPAPAPRPAPAPAQTGFADDDDIPF